MAWGIVNRPSSGVRHGQEHAEPRPFFWGSVLSLIKSSPRCPCFLDTSNRLTHYTLVQGSTPSSRIGQKPVTIDCRNLAPFVMAFGTLWEAMQGSMDFILIGSAISRYRGFVVSPVSQ